MYDFEFGTSEEIASNELEFLIFIKHLLPRWCNSIPDSEFAAIYHLLESQKDHLNSNSVLVETGAGASSLVLLNFAMKNNLDLFSWEINATKCAFLRGVYNDTLGKYYRKSLWDYWKYVPCNSLSDHIGLSILGELKKNVVFCFLDSEHTLKTMLGELNALDPVLAENAIVAIDDANYNYKFVNVSYVNMQRKKLGLPPVVETDENIGGSFFDECSEVLKENWNQVEHIDDTYKKNYSEDLYWAYFAADRREMKKQGMEKFDQLEHRFDAWRVSARSSKITS